ncbi:SIMPL domain-containing protein [Nostoc sp. CHAB 5834]|nr:SIMPL domain-containing protein [Nostoc sp. CHAB 5834]
MQKSKLATLVALTLAATLSHAAGSEQPYVPTLNLSAEVKEMAAPDQMQVTLAVERSGKDLASANKQVLEVTAEALRQAKAAGLPDAALDQVSTSQTYDEKGKPTGWRVRAQVELAGSDFEPVSQLSGRLAQKMELVDVSFGLSRAKRAEVQGRLLTASAKAFMEKARTAAVALGYRTATVKEVNINENGFIPRPMPMMKARAGAFEMAADMPPVPTSGSNVEVSVTTSGQVELVK